MDSQEWALVDGTCWSSEWRSEGIGSGVWRVTPETGKTRSEFECLKEGSGFDRVQQRGQEEMEFLYEEARCQVWLWPFCGLDLQGIRGTQPGEAQCSSVLGGIPRAPQGGIRGLG